MIFLLKLKSNTGHAKNVLKWCFCVPVTADVTLLVKKQGGKPG